MASRLPSQVLRRIDLTPVRVSVSKFSISQQCIRSSRPYSTETQQIPPLLTKLKGDLKAAMKAKDTARLGVLRSVFAATTNASKTNAPIKTDVQIVALLRKFARSSQDAVDEARAAGREDLVEKEETQIKILNDYAAESGVQSIGEEELRGIIQACVSEAAADGVTDKNRQSGEVMKKLMMKGGPLDGKDVDKSSVAKLVKEIVA